MKLSAVREPDGSVVVAGLRYRLEERNDRFVVVRADDGGELGAFRVTDVAHGFEIEAAPAERRVVEAIARLFAAPRGLLPLQ
jgi:hypothetical protein